MGVTSMLKVYWGIPMFWWVLMSIFGALIANIIAIGAIVGLIRRFEVRKRTSLFEDIEVRPEHKSSILRISVFTSIAATGSFVILFGLAAITSAVYEHYYPKPAVEFGIYDI